MFNRLLNKHINDFSLQLCSEKYFTSALKRRANNRRNVSDPIVVAGFGTNDDWRRNGLWDAFNRLSDFQLYEVPDHKLPHAVDEYDEMRIKKDGFLHFISEIEQTKKVNIAFFSHSGRHISDDLISELHKMGIWTIIMSVDDKHQFIKPIDKRTSEPHQLRVARQADIYLTNWEYGCAIVSSSNGNPYYMPEGANPDYHVPLNLPRDIDVLFIGSKYGYRQKLINYLLKAGVRVLAYGHGWPNGDVTYDEMVTLINRAKIVLGISGVGNTLRINHLKGRDFEVPMCGAVYLTNYNPELANLFAIGQEIICYGSFEECYELIMITLHDDVRMGEMRIAARNASISKHTWENRWSKIISLLQQID